MNAPAAASTPSRRQCRLPRTFLKCLLALGALLGLLYIAVRYYHIHYHAPCLLSNCYPQAHIWNQPQWRGNSLWLPDYAFDIHGREINTIHNNLSGLSYADDRKQLIAVINSPPELLVLDLEGNIIQRHRLSGANDTEGVAYLGNGKAAVLQEKRRSILLIDIPLPHMSLQPIKVDEVDAYQLNIPEDRNNGPEGITYDAASDTLYIAKERQPVGLYAITGLLTQGHEPVQNDLSALLAHVPFATDISSLSHDPVHGNLVLLSDEAQMLITITTRGEQVNYLDLASLALRLPPPQPEGVAIAPDGTIFIVSEPNLFYRLRPSHTWPQTPDTAP